MVYPLKRGHPSFGSPKSGDRNDPKYEHWLKVGPKNIEERNTNYGEASKVPTPASWKGIEKEQPGENEQMFEPWENSGDGTFGKQLEGEKARKPFTGEEID